MQYTKHILITGGAGFIGSHLVRRMVNTYPEYLIINYDALTYAGNLENLEDLKNAENYVFVKGDILDTDLLQEIFEKYQITDVIHTAAESHVDRSIANPLAFVQTNVLGTCTLLNIAKEQWKENLDQHTFYHISTDEVYGSLGKEGLFEETTAYDPHSPYSASKASSDHFVRAYHDTYGLRVVISNCSNNYGPFQFPEKLIPLMINNIVNEKPLPVYGDGKNIRDWLYVEDHAQAIDLIFHQGITGETYNIGGVNEWQNIDLVNHLCDIMDGKLGREPGTNRKLITFVKDRAGHDQRYAIDISKIKNELGWTPEHNFEQGLDLTVDWYLQNKEWVENVVSGEYQNFYQEQYTNR